MKEITIVAVTFNHGRKLNIFLDTLLEQHAAEDYWKCVVLHDGSPSSTDPLAKRSAEETRARIQPYTFLHSEKIRYVENEQRANIWGHDLRERGLHLADTPYIHFTNCDNQYTYGWLERLVPVLKQEQPDFIHWPCIHSYTEFHLFVPEMRGGHIDFCNYAIKTAIAKEQGFPWRHFEADGAQVENFVKNYPQAKIRKMTNIFAIHN